MNEGLQQADSHSSFATLIRICATYCHPETDSDAYDGLKRLVRRKNDAEMTRLKEELRAAISAPEHVPRDELFQKVKYVDGSTEKFLRRLWQDLYPQEPVPD